MRFKIFRTYKNHKKITGFSTPAELTAYEKGRSDEEKVFVKYLSNYAGETNSTFGQLLYDKFKELWLASGSPKKENL